MSKVATCSVRAGAVFRWTHSFGGLQLLKGFCDFLAQGQDPGVAGWRGCAGWQGSREQSQQQQQHLHAGELVQKRRKGGKKITPTA